MSIIAAVEGYSPSPNVSESPANLCNLHRVKCNTCESVRFCTDMEIGGPLVCGRFNVCHECMINLFDNEENGVCEVEIVKCEFCKKKGTCLCFIVDGPNFFGDLQICSNCTDKIFTENKADDSE